MSFESLAPQPPLFPPEAEAYSRRAIELSCRAARKCDVTFDLAYGKDPRQVLDVYRPKSMPELSLPVLFFIHGGAWTNGYKEWFGLLAPSITSFPALFVSASCRLAPEHRFPAPFDDCVQALAWVYENIGGYGGDGERIYVGGHSSGGHLTSLATLRRDKLCSMNLPESLIKACFPVSARFNMLFGSPPPGSTEHRHQYMLFAPGKGGIHASPMHLVEGCTTPFLLTYGSADIPAIIENNEQMYSALKQHGAPAERLVLPKHDHFDTALEIRHAQSPWMRILKRWMLGGTNSK